MSQSSQLANPKPVEPGKRFVTSQSSQRRSQSSSLENYQSVCQTLMVCPSMTVAYKACVTFKTNENPWPVWRSGHWMTSLVSPWSVWSDED